ncbi:MAG: alpha/beta hydrolase [Bacteroidales bacterium]|nr:alpha/beta hydrolase [Bacteroidales bacterium]
MKKSVGFRGGIVCYTVSGEGDVVILIHGYLESAEVWGGFAEQLAKRYRVLAVDLPGNGRSSDFDTAHTMCFLADSVMAVLDSEKVSRAFVVGHSLGGYVALNMAERYPERLAGYILFHSHPYSDSDEVKENRMREIGIVESGKKELIYPVNIPRMFASLNLSRFEEAVEKSKQIASAHTGRGIIAILEGMMGRKDRSAILTSGRLPSMVLLGRMDNYIDYDTMTGELTIPDNGSLITLETSGHMGFIEETEKSVALVDSFIRRVQSIPPENV